MQEICIRGGGSRLIGSRSVPTSLTLEVYQIDFRVDLKNHPNKHISEVLDDQLYEMGGYALGIPDNKKKQTMGVGWSMFGGGANTHLSKYSYRHSIYFPI